MNYKSMPMVNHFYLNFQMLQEVCEPLECICVPADPEKIHFLDCQVTITLVVAIPSTKMIIVKCLVDGWTDGPKNKQTNRKCLFFLSGHGTKSSNLIGS